MTDARTVKIEQTTAIIQFFSDGTIKPLSDSKQKNQASEAHNCRKKDEFKSQQSD